MIAWQVLRMLAVYGNKFVEIINKFSIPDLPFYPF